MRTHHTEFGVVILWIDPIIPIGDSSLLKRGLLVKEIIGCFELFFFTGNGYSVREGNSIKIANL